jgi:hypothetical protein
MQNGTAKTELPVQTASTGLPELDCQDRTAKTKGKTPEQDCQDIIARTRMPRQDSQSSFCYDIMLILAFILVLKLNLKRQQCEIDVFHMKPFPWIQIEIW